jgi:hypothetical protein
MDAQEVQDGVNERQWVRWTTRDEQTRPYLIEERAVYAVPISVKAARDRTGAHRHNKLWRWHTLPSEPNGLPHVACEWASDDQGVGMSG